jgi:two-component system, OmpR family, phosphate regulon sensor histidine kinase PhoR
VSEPRKLIFSDTLFIAAFVLIVFSASAVVARYYFKHQFQRQLEAAADSAITLLLVAAPSHTDPEHAQAWCQKHALGTPYRLTLKDLSGKSLCEFPLLSTDAPSVLTSSANDEEKGVVLQLQVAEDPMQPSLIYYDRSVLMLLVFILGAFGVFIVFSREALEVPEVQFNQIQTDLKQKTEALSQEREELATLMSAISDAILAVDLTGKPLFFNSRFALSFFGFAEGKQTRQPHLGEVFRDPVILDAFHAAFEHGVNQQASIKLYVKGDTTPRFFSISIAPLRHEEGPVYGAVGIFHDVTELKRAENIRIEFVANVSHELRTPLTAIKGYTDTLREDVAQKKFDTASEFLEIIARNSDRLMRLIVDLLDLSSLESQDAAEKMSKTEVNTTELTQRVLTQLESRRADKGHTIGTVYGAPTVFADPARAEQVLVNLLENSIKYVPSSGKVSILWEKKPNHVLLKVSDNGPGIPIEHHSRLFERFYRVDQARSRELGGTGLGLAIVKHIMQQHGGSVWINSESGKGTEFVCQFPSAHSEGFSAKA